MTLKAIVVKLGPFIIPSIIYQYYIGVNTFINKLPFPYIYQFIGIFANSFSVNHDIIEY